MTQLARITIPALSCLLPLSACASGSGQTSFAPAPKAGLRTSGYAAPDIGAVSRAPSAPVRIAQPAKATPVRPVAANAASLEYAVNASARANTDARIDTAQGEVPAPPPRDWSAAPTPASYEPLPDLDDIVVTRETPRLAAARLGSARAAQPKPQPQPQPEPRSVMPQRRAQPAERPGRAEGGYALHLASYRYPDQAEAGWSVLTEAHPRVLNGLAPLRAAVDLPDQGRFHRLLAGPLPQGQAGDACAALEAEGTYCAVVPWDGTPL